MGSSISAKSGVLVPAQPLCHWVTVNKPVFLSAPQVHLCEVNVGVCPCSSPSSCSGILGPGSALGCCSSGESSSSGMWSAPGMQVPWLSCLGLVHPFCEDLLLEGPFRILLRKCHKQPTSGENVPPAAEEELGVRKQLLCSLRGLQRGELLQDQDP